MAIAVGDRLPDVHFVIATQEGPVQKSTAEIFSGKKIALFAVPGAFTPTCNNTHLPGFLAEADALKAKGVDEICCIAVNDVFVLGAWAKATGAEGEITFLSDGSAKFTKAIGLELDGSEKNLGIRSHRYAMLVDDGVVKIFNLETVPSNADESSAKALLDAM